MDVKKLNHFKAVFKNERSIIRLTLIVITLTSVINYTSIENIKNNQQTIVVPLNQSSQFWASGSDASSEYLTSLGLYVVQLWQNYTPANASLNFSKLLELASSENYQDIKQQLKNKSALIKKYNRNSYSFEATKVKINRTTQNFLITGLKTRWTKSGVKSPQKVKLTINYQINNALFSITDLKEELL